MSRFIVRVELRKANPEDYEMLHNEMLKLDFFKIIKDDKTGKYYHLPDAEYYYVGEIMDIENLINRVHIAASKINKEYQVLVTKSAGIIFFGLDELEE